MLEESISAYKDDAGGCSEPFPAHVALRAACIRRGKVAQRTIGIILLYRAAPFFSAFSQKTTLFLPQRRCKSRTETRVPQNTYPVRSKR